MDFNHRSPGWTLRETRTKRPAPPCLLVVANSIRPRTRGRFCTVFSFFLLLLHLLLLLLLLFVFLSSSFSPLLFCSSSVKRDTSNLMYYYPEKWHFEQLSRRILTLKGIKGTRCYCRNVIIDPDYRGKDWSGIETANNISSEIIKDNFLLKREGGDRYN